MKIEVRAFFLIAAIFAAEFPFGYSTGETGGVNGSGDEPAPEDSGTAGTLLREGLLTSNGAVDSSDQQAALITGNTNQVPAKPACPVDPVIEALKTFKRHYPQVPVDVDLKAFDAISIAVTEIGNIAHGLHRVYETLQLLKSAGFSAATVPCNAEREENLQNLLIQVSEELLELQQSMKKK